MVKVYHITKFGEQYLGEMDYARAVETVASVATDETFAFWLGDGNELSGEFYPADAMNQLRRLAGDFSPSVTSGS